MRRSVVLQKRHVIDRDLLERADARASSLLWAFARRRSTRIAYCHPDERTILYGIDKCAWDRDTETMIAMVGYDRISSIHFIHHLLHGLMNSFFGEMNGKPRASLFSEAVASCADLYLLSSLVPVLLRERYKGNLYSCVNLLTTYRENSKESRKPFVRALLRASKDPFGSYKRAVNDTMRAYERFLRYTVGAWRGRPSSPASLRTDLLSLEEFVFIRRLDFANHLAFTATYSGCESSASDVRLTAKAQAALEQSDSFVEFLLRLGIDRDS